MFFIEWIVYACIGIVAGFLGGLLGIGGGLIVVPSLLVLFHFLKLPSIHLIQMAIGTSLGAMVFTAASSAWAHYLKKGVYWHFVFPLAPGILLGALLGAFIALHVPSRGLEFFFGFCECLIGIYFLISTKKQEMEVETTFQPHSFLLAIIGIGIGAISTILGIGGGIITVPILTAFRVPIRNAISTSAVIGFLIAVMGAFAFLYPGLGESTTGSQVGYLYMPALIGIGATSSLAAPYGAIMAYRLPHQTLRRVFGCILILIGIWMMMN